MYQLVLFPLNNGATNVYYVLILSYVLSILAIIGIWKKDNAKYFGIGGEKQEKTKVSGYVEIIKNNGPMKRLMVAGAGCKLALSIATNVTVVGVLVLLLLWKQGVPGRNLMLFGENRLAINIYTILFIVFFGIGYGAYYSTADMPIPMVAWAVTLLVMKGYELTGPRMKEIQAINAARKEAIAGGMSLEDAMAKWQTIEDVDKK